MRERAHREFFEGIEPAAPRSALRKLGEKLDDRQCEALQVLEVVSFSSKRDRFGAFGILELQPPNLELTGESGEASLPPLDTSDHGGVDEKFLPSPRCAQAPLDGGLLFRLVDSFGLGEEVEL